MEQIIKPISDIAFLNTGLLLLGESGQKITSFIYDCSLENIQGMAFHLGGEFNIYNKEVDTLDSKLTLGTFVAKIKETELRCTFNLSEIGYANQFSAFSGNTFICEKGTQLTIIDNSYFVF